MVKREGTKFGVSTNNSLKWSHYIDYRIKAVGEVVIYSKDDDSGIVTGCYPHSLNKHNRWELLNNKDNYTFEYEPEEDEYNETKIIVEKEKSYRKKYSDKKEDLKDGTISISVPRSKEEVYKLCQSRYGWRNYDIENRKTKKENFRNDLLLL
ncbi:hypothetical protein ABK040_006830 [Willaertia magna]